jgi:hypothetical protein
MRLFLKSVIVFCIPILTLIIIYVWTDPFKVIYNYSSYLSDYVMLNRGFVSTEVFLKNNRNYNFNSFIFGSSRSIAYTCDTWGEYLSKDCSIFSYGNWNESIEGILKKVQLIDSKGNKIMNVIIVIDPDLTFIKSNRTISYDHYLISGKNLGQFHLMNLSKWFRDYRLILTSIDYKLFKTRRSYMRDFIGMKSDDINPINNDWLLNSEVPILKDSVTYYSKNINKFYTRPKLEQESRIQISSSDSLMMQKINSVFKKHKTNVKIIIGPLYDQIRFNKNDLQCLQAIFGRENIFDFSGINDITNNMYNYLGDASHYRNRTGSRILKRIYSVNQTPIKQFSFSHK